MEGCKARSCIKNPSLKYKRIKGGVWNDFKRCNRPIFHDGFCKICYEHDKRKSLTAINDNRWKRDGIYGEPYAFPYHKNITDKIWVQMIYDLHPEISPKNYKFWKNHDKIETREELIKNLKKNLTDEEKIYLCEQI